MNNLEITSIEITLLDNNPSIKASVKVVIGDCLVLNNLRIIKGQFGHFLSFPSISPQCPHKCFECTSTAVRRELQRSVLQKYAQVLASDLQNNKNH